MKWFFSITFPDGRKHGSGPFDSEALADSEKAVMAEACPTRTLGDPFEEEENFQFPGAVSDVGRGDGSRYLVYEDGSTTDLT